jgi:hypothetical protein
VDQLVGKGRRTPLRVAVAIVAVLAVLGLVRLLSGGPDRAPPARSTPAAPSPPVPVRLPTTGCGEVDALRLHDLAVSPHPPSQPADPLADLEITACGPRGAVLVTPDGDALLSPADIAGDADATACAEAIREGAVDAVRVGAGATFCAVQRAGTAEHFGGQVLARLTVIRDDAVEGVTVAVVRWPT